MSRSLAAVTVALALVGACSDSGDDPGASSAATTVAAEVPDVDGEVPDVDGAGGATGVVLVPVVAVAEPIDLRQRPGTDDLYVAARAGVVSKVVDGQLSAEPLVDVSDRTRASGERGLLGFTFSPDGARIYLHYTDLEGTTTVEERTIEGEVAAESTSRILLTQEQPYPNHNGGELTFGPDGMLYLGLGDGGSGGDPQGNGQDLATWLGKILRIDPTPDGDAPYTIPPDNPFASGEGGALPEIWSFGLRNPWRFSFDRDTGDLWIGDVGQSEVEEIDHSPAADGAGRGVNFGWNRFEGNDVFDDGTDAPGAVGPVHTFTHSGDGACSVTGGFVIRDPALTGIDGTYVFTDVCWDHLRIWLPVGGAIDVGVEVTRVVSFAEDLDGHIYVLSFDGTVYQLVPAG